MNIRISKIHRGSLVSFSLSLAVLLFYISVKKLEAQDGGAVSPVDSQGGLTERDLSVVTTSPINQPDLSPLSSAGATPNEVVPSSVSSSSSPSFSVFEVTGGVGQEAISASSVSAATFSISSGGSASSISASDASMSAAPPAMAVTYAARPVLPASSPPAGLSAVAASSLAASAASSIASPASTFSSLPAASEPVFSASNAPALLPESPTAEPQASAASSSALSTAAPTNISPTPSSAEAILRSPGVSLVDYPVRGINYAEITKDLDLFSTGGAGGTKSDFGFTWVLSWSYTTDSVTSQPVVKVSPRFNVELPRWTNFEMASERDREFWASYRALLLRGIEARILLVQAFVPRAETEIQAFVTQNPKAKQIEIDDVLNSTIRVLQTRLRTLQSTEASDVPRKPLLGIGAQ